MQRKALFTFFLFTATMLCGSFAFAQKSKSDIRLYKWVDENGKVHYSSVIPPEDNINQIDMLKKNGLILKHSDAQKTQAEILKEKEEQLFLLQNKKTMEEMQRRAKVLRERFKNIADLDSYHQKAIFEIDKQIISLKDKKQTLIERIKETKEDNSSEEFQEQLFKDLSTVDRYILTLEQQKISEIKRQQEDKELWLKMPKR